MKRAVNFRDKNEIKRYAEQGTPVAEIAKYLRIAPDVVERFMPDHSDEDDEDATSVR